MRDIVKLNNGVNIPCIGFGTADIGGWQANNNFVSNVVLNAIHSGYRYLDTSAVGGNETSVGKAIEQSEINRKELFVCSKVWNTDQGYESTLNAFEASKKRLNLDYIDLYLIHWPVPGKIKETWKALEYLYKQGDVRSIGVSNFGVRQINRLLDVSSTIPVCNQIEFHPYFQQNQLVEFCSRASIQVVGWGPLGTGGWNKTEVNKKPILDAKIAAIAQKYKVSSAQVILKWHLQKGIIPIPKTESITRMKQNKNLDFFCLDQAEVEAINLLNKNQPIGPEAENLSLLDEFT